MDGYPHWSEIRGIHNCKLVSTVGSGLESPEWIISEEIILLDMVLSFVVVVFLDSCDASTVDGVVVVAMSVATASSSGFLAPPARTPSVVVVPISGRFIVLRVSQRTDECFHPDGSYGIKKVARS